MRKADAVYLRDVVPSDDEVARLVAQVDDPAFYAPYDPIGPV